MYAALSRGLSFKLTMGNILTLTPALTITHGRDGQALDINRGMPGGGRRRKPVSTVSLDAGSSPA